MTENIISQEKRSYLIQALLRTDQYIMSMDQKNSFILASGVAFLGIYSAVFLSIISSKQYFVPIWGSISILGIILCVWAYCFFKIKKVFSPKLDPSKQRSIMSWASIIGDRKDKQDRTCFLNAEEYYLYYSNIADLNDLDKDLAENHWICSSICMKKATNFKSALRWTFISLVISSTGMAIILLWSSVIK